MVEMTGVGVTVSDTAGVLHHATISMAVGVHPLGMCFCDTYSMGAHLLEC